MSVNLELRIDVNTKNNAFPSSSVLKPVFENLLINASETLNVNLKAWHKQIAFLLSTLSTMPFTYLEYVVGFIPWDSNSLGMYS